MYFEECDYHDRVGFEVLKVLKSFGLKYKLKKSFLKGTLMEEHKKKEVCVFGKPLCALRKVEVLLPQAKEVICIPEFLVKASTYIEENIATEGLFRKAGSTARQKDLKVLLDKGGQFDPSVHNVIDVANVLKTFLRELPEPLIPYKYHDNFLRCMLLKDRREEAVILTCLLLPQDHMNSLAYLMMFLNRVASESDMNKMTANNLAIIIAPSVMPVASPKMTPRSNQILTSHVQICQILIKNSNLIGVVPEHILSGELSFSNSSVYSSYTNDRSVKKKKKRRSSSLTRVLNGLKKIVSGRVTPDFDSSRTPDTEVHTPCIMSTGKKRKATESAAAPLSSKKKKELIQGLPQGSVLSDTPYKNSCSNHRSDKLTPRILVPTQKLTKTPPQKLKRSFFSKTNADGTILKPVKSLSGSGLKVSRISLLGRSSRKKKEKEESMTSRDSSGTITAEDSMEVIQKIHVSSLQEISRSSGELEEYVRVPKSEYEAIKERVSKIESRLSHEFENIIGVSISDSEFTPDRSSVHEKSISTAEQVQNVYKKTLRESDKLNNSSTEELAKLLSQELNIRRNPENKVIRSPSARKIGSIRRRSKESCVSVNVDSCISSDGSCSLTLHSSRSLRRGKPNTVCTGLPHPHFKPDHLCIHNVSSHSTGLEPENDKEYFGILTRSQARRASSFHGLSQQQQQINQNTVVLSHLNYKNIDWKCGKQYFEENLEGNEESLAENRRASIAKLRCQNAGMVLAKAKLFDNMGDNMMTKENKMGRHVSKAFRHNNMKNRSSVRKKHSDRKIQEMNLKLVTNKDEIKNSPGCTTKINNKLNNSGDKINMIYNKTIHQTMNDHSLLQKQKTKIGKENVFLNNKQMLINLNSKEPNVTSPLKDSNRTPSIKRSLTVNLSSQLKRTPRDLKSIRNTPIKPLNHPVTPRKSPRLLLKSKHVSTITGYK
ncbi:uncharacterized protein LOC142324475 [Lycorma delicatula]|uniref:uncharacterized protein LOC142324475 n=1 Tax=Lycorma delicatula TaxID=130591 RepID=UPI003F519892